MDFISTRDPACRVDAATAILGSIAPDGGLFFPAEFPAYDLSSDIQSLREIGSGFLAPFFQEALGLEEFQEAIFNALTFPAPLRELKPGLFVLELFHGPTLAFKDFGARVMAELMSRLAVQQGRAVTVLTATSGDTGAAVASAFFKKPGVRVVVLYPKGRVSDLQERQMTTLGENITVVRVSGSFDDCQALVKQCFGDRDLSQRLGLVSANSINIARLLPQCIYYLSALQQLKSPEGIVFVTPSGNFGNIFAGMLLRFMGFHSLQFVAASNANRTFVDFLESGRYEGRASVATMSNVMDVGAPSNLERIRLLVRDDLQLLRSFCWATSISDGETAESLKRVAKEFGFVCCPHTAVGLEAARRYRERVPGSYPIVCLATAHPAKFADVIKSSAGIEVKIPEQLAQLVQRDHRVSDISNSFAALTLVLPGS